MADEHSSKNTDIETPVTTQEPLQSSQPSGLTVTTPKSDEQAPDPEGLRWFRAHSIPIAGIILIALVLCLVGHYSSVTLDWARTKEFTDALRNLVQALAFIGGGIWAYFKFVKGRTFQESLTPVVTGKFASIDGVIYLIAITQIKNVGLSKIVFNHYGSALILYEYLPSTEKEIHTVADKRLTSFEVFHEKDRYIEPNEIMEAQRFISVPGPLQLAYRLEVEILSKSGFTWRATTIVDKSSLNDNIGRELIGL